VTEAVSSQPSHVQAAIPYWTGLAFAMPAMKKIASGQKTHYLVEEFATGKTGPQRELMTFTIADWKSVPMTSL
jgi:hypothetical protein